MICFHHLDPDGYCSGAILYSKYPDAKYVGVNYDKDFPFDLIEKNELVFIVDFSLQKEGEWERLKKNTNKIVWIDHHVSVIENAPEFTKKFDGIRDGDACGAKLTWNFIYPELKVPRFVELIDRWDRWTHNDDPEVINFIYGLKSYDLSPGTNIWKNLLIDSSAIIVKIQNEGKIIFEYEKVSSAQELKEYGYEVEFEGYRCIVLHRNVSNSKTFDSIKGKYDITIAVSYNGKLWTLHLSSEKVKVNEIAMKYGGNGHDGSAGCQLEKLPWL